MVTDADPSDLIPGQTTPITYDLLQAISKFGEPYDPGVKVKKEEGSDGEELNFSENEDFAESGADSEREAKAIAKAPIKLAVPRIRELVKMAKDHKQNQKRMTRNQSKQTKKTATAATIEQRKTKGPKMIRTGKQRRKPATVKQIKQEDGEVEGRRAKWRGSYYKRKAAGEHYTLYLAQIWNGRA